jgi:hypothetical protein
MAAKTRRTRPAKTVRTRRVSDALIRRTFVQLGLGEAHRGAYKSAQDFAKGFQRCTLLKVHDTNYAAHAMV